MENNTFIPLVLQNVLNDIFCVIIKVIDADGRCGAGPMSSPWMSRM